MIIDDPDRHDDIAKSLRGLNKLAKILKQKRIDKGYIPYINLQCALKHFWLECCTKVFYKSVQLLLLNLVLKACEDDIQTVDGDWQAKSISSQLHLFTAQ